MRKIKYILIVVLLMWGITLSANTYYVSTTGNDSNPGTISQPWATWQKGFNTAVAGDTVFFRGGVYYRQQADDELQLHPGEGKGHNGTVGNPIVFMGYPADRANGDTAIYDCINYNPPGEPFVTAYNTGIHVLTAENIVFKDFVVRNVLQRREYVMCQGMAVLDSKNMTLENLSVYNNGGHGIFTSTAMPVEANTWYLTNIDAYNNIDTFAINEYNYNLGQAGSWGVGLFITASEFTRVIMDGCRAWNNADDGINTNPGGQIILKNSWAFSNGVYLEYLSYETEGNGYKLNGAWEEAIDNPERVLHIVYNNIAAFNLGLGYTENSNGLPYMYRFIYNNIAYKNDQGFVIQGNRPEEYEHRDNQYINNIAYLNTIEDFGEYQGGFALTEMYNSWNTPPGVTLNMSDFVYTDDAVILAMLKAPRNTDNSLPANPFALIGTSDLIDAGFNIVDSLAKVDETFRYSGAAVDLGPSEYYNKKAVFIHHSSGGNWVADAWGGLGEAMNDAGYFFSGIDYGWDAPYNTDIGDYTDIGDWWTWFMDQTVQGNSETMRDNIMGAVYTEYDKDIQFGDYTRTLSDPGGENEIIMFKSCYPNSDILADNATNPEDIYGDPAGSNTYTETNVRALYDTILTYFKANPGRMFVVITAPPLSAATNAARARSFNNWLVNDWLQDADWENKNVYVWDWYNVLTDADNHHRVENGVVVHTTDPTSGNTAIYVDGDDHPNEAGCQKSTAEFVPVLDLWYESWANYVTPPTEPAIDSTLTDILTFTLPTQTGAATINTTNHTVAIEVSYLATVTNLTPYISLSYGATISPASMTSRDFTTPQTYTVTALDGTTTQEWVVTVTQAEEPVTPAGDSAIVKYRGLIMKL